MKKYIISIISFLILFSNFIDSTVGINVEMSHLAPTKLNDEVKVECELINVEGRILTFNILAYDSNTLVSKMVHKRCIVNKEKFMSKVK